MNKIGIHYGAFITNWMDDQYPLIEKVADLGYDMLEFGCDYLLLLSKEEKQRFKSKAQAKDIELTLSLGLTPTQDIGSPNALFRQTGLRRLQQVAQVMSSMGITDCSGIIYSSWNGKISSYEEKMLYWENSVKTMKEAAKTFEDLGVYFNVEVVNRFETFLINTCKEANDYINQVGSPNIGIHLDTFHMNIEESSMITPFFEAGKRLRYIHFGENNRKMPGLGNMPWKTIIDAIKLSGYTRPISIETFVKPGGQVGSAVSLYRPLMDTTEYDQQLRQSVQFVRTVFAQ